MEEIRNPNSPFLINEDRISSLPEPLIHHILSFLEMKHVVRTSFLSRRWRYVWTSVSTLVFKSHEFYQDYQQNENENEDEDVSRSLERFIDSVLMLRGISDIMKFHLYNDCGSPRIEEKQIDRWILAIVRRNVQELHLRLENDVSTLRLPQCLVTSELLTGLVLDFDGDLSLSDSVMSLPRLKSLFLCSFDIDDLRFVNNLLSGCPVLQNLVIKQICGPVGDELTVNNRQLKHLEIVYYPYYESAPRIIRLCTPSLTSFICEDQMVRDYRLENVSSLVTATMKLSKLEGDGIEELLPKCMVFFMAFRNVKELTLSLDILQVLSGAPKLIDCRLPQLRNLRCLKLEMHFNRCYLLALTDLLTISPCLDSLFITSKEPDFEDNDEAMLSGSCILSHLKYIEIREVKGCKNELILVEFVLKNAPVLEEMLLYFRSAGSSTSLDTIGIRDKLNARKKFGEKIKALPRVSPCFIMIFS